MNGTDSRLGDALTLRVQARQLRGRAARRLPEAIRPQLAAGRAVILDLSDVETLGSTGLATLLRCRYEAWRQGAEVCLCGAQPEVRRLLLRARFHRLFDVFHDAAQAQVAAARLSAGAQLGGSSAAGGGP